MRKLLLALAFLPVLALSGCTPDNSLLLQVQAAMVNTCAFLPAPLTMAAQIIASYNLAAGATAAAIAAAATDFCGKLQAAQTTKGAPMTGQVINGVTVDGVWVEVK